ncbi:hypothetical protein GCM10017673_48420 [Streptosporangium violaceochromogenes]|nr:hypothetical protein GCM10017673_48420 [Streptosporangium violaceochromogenes]
MLGGAAGSSGGGWKESWWSGILPSLSECREFLRGFYLPNRDFTAEALNQRYVGDITYLSVGDGQFLYLTIVLDLHSRRLAGWSIADHMRTELVADALRAAEATRGRLAGAIFHSDHGHNAPPPSSPPCAGSPACGSRWARSAAAWTTPRPRRSTPR